MFIDRQPHTNLPGPEEPNVERASRSAGARIQFRRMGYKHLAALRPRLCSAVNASKTCMAFFQKPWEQKTRRGCLRGSLSGNGQKFTALIPAPGGDQ
jgi:hypothetical protein